MSGIFGDELREPTRFEVAVGAEFLDGYVAYGKDDQNRSKLLAFLALSERHHGPIYEPKAAS